MRSLSVLLGAAIVLSFSSVAQGGEKYLQVGTDSDGDAFMLDTQTMGRKERRFGEVLKVYLLKKDLMFEYMLRASCGDERLWMVGSRVYNGNAVKVSEERHNKELPARADTPSANAMKHYCQSIGARGWL